MPHQEMTAQEAAERLTAMSNDVHGWTWDLNETDATACEMGAAAIQREAEARQRGEVFVPIDRSDMDSIASCGHYMRFRLPCMHEDESESMSCMQCDRDRAQQREARLREALEDAERGDHVAAQPPAPASAVGEFDRMGIFASLKARAAELRRLHIAFNVAAARATGRTFPACDGPDCSICQVLAALRQPPEGVAGAWREQRSTDLTAAPYDRPVLVYMHEAQDAVPVVGCRRRRDGQFIAVWNAEVIADAVAWMPLPQGAETP